MAVGTGAGFTADFSQVREALTALNSAKDAMNALDPLRGVKGYSPIGNRMQSLVRSETRKMSDRIIVPAIKSSASTRGNTFDQRIADTARGVNDRLPVVKVGKVMPKLSGWKYVQQDQKTRMRGTLAHGSEYGPMGGHRPGSRKHNGKSVNYYGKPRNDRGYWVRPAIESALVTRQVIGAYRDLINDAFRRFGVNKVLGGSV